MIDVVELKKQAEGRWVDIIPSMVPDLAPAFEKVGQHVACPMCNGTSGKNLRVYPKAADQGMLICNTCGAHAGLDALLWAGWSYLEAIREVNDILNGVASKLSPEQEAKLAAEKAAKQAKAAKQQEADDKRYRQRLNKVWKETLPLTDALAEPARRYLASRGLPVPRTEEIRFHPNLAFSEKVEGKNVFRGNFPAIVTRFRAADGKPVSLHRTYLTRDGRKAPFDDVKKLMTTPSTTVLTGGAIRLTPVSVILGIAEGIETALSVPLLNGINCWAAYSATMLENFVPPAGVEKVIIFADKDKSGRGYEAALKLVERLWAMGIMASIQMPEDDIPDDAKGIDWNNVLMQRVAA